MLVKQHVSHRNLSCFDLTACVVLNQFQTENELSCGDKRVALDAVKLHRCQHRFLSEDEILFQAISLLPDSVRMASFVSRIFVTYATAWWPINCYATVTSVERARRASHFLSVFSTLRNFQNISHRNIHHSHFWLC